MSATAASSLRKRTERKSERTKTNLQTKSDFNQALFSLIDNYKIAVSLKINLKYNITNLHENGEYVEERCFVKIITC